MKNRWILMGGAVPAALAVNLLLFLLIPVLSHISDPGRTETVSHAFTFNNMRQPPPPPPPEEPDPREPPPPKAPPKVSQMPSNRASQTAVRPKMPAMSSPPTFDAAVEGLKFGTMVFSPVSRPQNRFDISQVDTMPEVISRINPVYPYKARQKGINGMVVLKFLVTGEGRVAQVSVEQANPPGVFDAAAIQAVSQWRFKPGILDREPVATWITVPLKFQIK